MADTLDEYSCWWKLQLTTQEGVKLRIACFSDVHGNKVALDAVLDDLAQVGPDTQVFLGDLAGLGPQPGECVQELAELEVLSVMGNSDYWLLDPGAYVDPTPDQSRFEEIEWWCRQQLSRDEMAVLEGLQPTQKIEVEGMRIAFCHGSPKSFHHPIRVDTPGGQLDEWLAGVEADLVVAGHTHVPMLRRHANALLANPGSVGLPYIQLKDRVRNPVWAEYLVIDTGRGRLDISHRRVEYPYSNLEVAVEESGMPNGKWWLGNRF